jgi:hypothetical protein
MKIERGRAESGSGRQVEEVYGLLTDWERVLLVLRGPIGVRDSFGRGVLRAMGSSVQPAMDLSVEICDECHVELGVCVSGADWVPFAVVVRGRGETDGLRVIEHWYVARAIFPPTGYERGRHREVLVPLRHLEAFGLAPDLLWLIPLAHRFLSLAKSNPAGPLIISDGR